MPAPDLATCFAVPDAILDGLKARLNPIIPTFLPRETENLPAQRVDAMFELGTFADHWGVDNTGTLQHSAWAYMLKLELATVVEPEGTDAFHRQMRGRLHSALHAAVLDPAWLPFHTLASLNEQGISSTVSTRDDCDISTLAFTGIVVIRGDAWPR